MNFIEFERQWEKQGLLSIHELRLWKPDFNRNNMTRWISQGYVTRLKQGWYALTEAMKRPEFHRFAAGRIYYPSYISLETALCAYDIIPEAVVDVTSVTARKTSQFHNALGNFYYYSVRPNMMFGYKPVPTPAGQYYWLALPEKAIIDFLYLHPEYVTEDDMFNLRYDEVFMADDLDLDRMATYLAKVNSKALTSRITTLLSIYDLSLPVTHTKTK